MLVNIAHVQDKNELCAAAFHDSLEDTEITKKQIANEFGICMLKMQSANNLKVLSSSACSASTPEQLATNPS